MWKRTPVSIHCVTHVNCQKIDAFLTVERIWILTFDSRFLAGIEANAVLNGVVDEKNRLQIKSIVLKITVEDVGLNLDNVLNEDPAVSECHTHFISSPCIFFVSRKNRSNVYKQCKQKGPDSNGIAVCGIEMFGHVATDDKWHFERFDIWRSVSCLNSYVVCWEIVIKNKPMNDNVFFFSSYLVCAPFGNTYNSERYGNSV